MATGYVVLAAATPPDSAKPVAIFIVGSTQDDNSTKQRAESWRDLVYPTSVVQPCNLDKYNTSIVITS